MGRPNSHHSRSTFEDLLTRWFTIDLRDDARLWSGDCLPIAGDNVRLAVNWQGQDRLPAPSAGPIRLRVTLRNARLYSYWFE